MTLPPLDDPARIFALDGRVGLVTGGAGRMGREFAAVLARAGARVVLADLDAAGTDEAAQRVAKATGREVEGLACDVADEASVTAAFQAIQARHGRLDFLVHNVMAKPPGYYRPFDAYPTATWEQVLDANLTGAFRCVRAASQVLPRGGAVVLTASIYALVGPDPGLYEGLTTNPYGGRDPLGLPASYAASKAGLVGLARWLATSWGSRGIRVNVLVPGGVEDGQDPAFVARYAARTPLGRMASWTDYNGALLFLVSDASRYMTGASLVVDGGWTSW